MMLTKNEIKTWFGYNPNHDDSTRAICDQAELAAQLQLGFEASEMLRMDANEKLKRAEDMRDGYKRDCVRLSASEAALRIRIQQLEDEIKVLNFELMSAQTGVVHSYRKEKP